MIKELNSFSYVSEVNKFFVEKVKSTEKLIILDSIDFYNFYDEIIWYLKNFISFANFWNWLENLWVEEIFFNNLDEFKFKLEEKTSKKYIFTKNLNTIKNFLELNNLENISVFKSDLNNLKSFKIGLNYVFTDDIISKIFVKRRVKRSFSENMDLLLQIKPGDYVVHIDHWVGIFSEWENCEKRIHNYWLQG